MKPTYSKDIARRINACREGTTELYLNDQRLSAIPDEIFDLTNLESLNLSYNKFRNLSPKIANLTRLKELVLVDCALYELPSELGELTSLTSVNLRGNAIKELPASIANLVKLTNLNLEWSPLRILPNWIGKLKNLKTLALGDAQLGELPESFAQLRALAELNLWKNKLTEFPEVLLSIPSLRVLNLSSNNIGMVPKDIKNLAKMKSINLSSANIEELPPELAMIASLKELDVSDNQIRRLPLEFAGAKLASIKISGNPIENLEATLVSTGDWDAIRDALAAQSGVAGAVESGKARYDAFVQAREFKKYSGLRTHGWSLPIEFDDPDTLRSRITEENEHFQEDLAEVYPRYVPLGMPLLSEEEYGNTSPSMLDEFLVVDTSSEGHAVLLWSHDGGFDRIARDFAAFLEGLSAE